MLSIPISSDVVTKLSVIQYARNIKGTLNTQYKLRNTTRVDLNKSKQYIQVYKTYGITNTMLNFQKITCIPRSPLETEDLLAKYYEMICSLPMSMVSKTTLKVIKIKFLVSYYLLNGSDIYVMKDM